MTPRTDAPQPMQSRNEIAATAEAAVATQPPAGGNAVERWFAGDLAGDFAGGLAGAIASLGLALPLGILAFAPLGPQYVAIGVAAGFAAALYGQLVAGLAGGTVHPGSVPRASTSLIIGTLVAALAAESALAPSVSQGPERVVALAAACVVLAGLLQLAIGWLRLGEFARYIPFPLVAGFMCGIAMLVVFAQLGPLTGATTRPHAGVLAFLREIQLSTVLVSAVTIAIYLITPRRAPRLPAALLALLAGCGLHYLLAFVAPGLGVGPVLGPITAALPTPTALVDLASIPWRDIASAMPTIATSALLVAAFGTLDTLFAAVAVDQATNGRHDPRREIVAHGLANVASGACGGVPVVYSTARALASYNAGGRTRRALLVTVAVLAVMVLAGAHWIAQLPIAVLAGILVVTCVNLVDRWVRALVIRLPDDAGRNPARLLSIATVAIVAVATVALGFLPALGIGLVLSVVIHLVGLNRSLIRSVVDGTQRPSRRTWEGIDANHLQAARERVRIVELEGPLFFANAERLASAVEAIGPPVDTIIIDFRLVTSIDATGALLVERLTRRMKARGIRIVLAGVTPKGRHGQAFVGYSAFTDPAERRWFSDADKALGWVERKTLAREHAGSDEELPLSRIMLLEKLSAGDIATVAALLVRREMPRGQVLFREGDPGDRLYMIARGAVEISVMNEGQRRSRIVTMAAGAVFGEVALLDGKPRSATATTAEPSVLYELSRDVLLYELATRHPSIAMMILATLSTQLSSRLRETTGLLRRMDDARG